MRVLLLSFEYPPETGFGGIGTYTWYQARALARLGHEVHVLAGAAEPTPLSATEHDGVRVYRYRGNGRLVRSFRVLRRLAWWWTTLRLENAVNMYHGASELMRQHRYDIVEMPECGGEGSVLNRRCRVPTVVRFHSPARLIMPFYPVSRGDRLACAAIEQRGIDSATAFSSCSKFLAGEVQHRLGVRRPVPVIPNGIDLSLFDAEEPIDVRRRFDLPADRLTILFTGRMERRKGIELCPEIAASILENHDVSLVFAGQDLFGFVADTLVPALRYRRLRGSFHYLGSLGQRDLRACVRACDIFLLPSLWENCPYSCLEAMAAGRAIVATDQGGMPELIRDGANGLLARSGDAGAFVAGLERLIRDDGLRAQLGRRARERVEASFTDERIARLTIDLYERCLNGRTAPDERPASPLGGDNVSLTTAAARHDRTRERSGGLPDTSAASEDLS